MAIMRPSVLFVSQTGRTERPFLDPSTRYRSHQMARALSGRGHRTAVISQAEFDENRSSADTFDYVAFHRPWLTRALAEFLHRNQDRIIADFDDAIFTVETAHHTPMHRFRDFSLTEVSQTIARTAEAASYFSRFTCSTAPLAEQLRETLSAERPVVVPNALDDAYLGLASLARSSAGPKRPYEFGYFPGTATHDADFAEIADALADAFESNTSAEMLLVGPVALPKQLERYQDRITRASIVPCYQLPFLYGLVDRVLAPIEITPFTLAKSGLKFFEAAVCGCQVVATPIPDIDRFNSPLLLKCRTPKDWRLALKQRLPPRPAREEAARQAGEDARISRSADKWLEVLA